jgi:hypothetical protein
VDLEWGPPSPVVTIQELLGRNNSGYGIEGRECGHGDLLSRSRDTLYPQKLALTSSTRGGHSIGIVSSRTKTKEFSFLTIFLTVTPFIPIVIKIIRNSILPPSSGSWSKSSKTLRRNNRKVKELSRAFAARWFVS